MANTYDSLEKVIIKCTNCQGKLRVLINQLGTIKCPHCNSKSSADTRGCGDWGYKFTGGAIDNFIQDIEGKEALNNYPEFCDRRNLAEQLMFDLVGQTPRLFYLTRQGQGKGVGEQIWGLTIATDSDGLELPERLEERGVTLGLIAAVNSNGDGGLKILSTRLLSKQKGKQDTFSAPFYLRLRSNYQDRIGVPQEAIERMAEMPEKKDCIPPEKQLEAWKAFLKVLERLAREKQFCVSFVSHNYGEATKNITFKIDANSATVDGKAENSLALDDFWERAKRARNQNNLKDRDGRELGTIQSIDSEKNLLKISLDSEALGSLAEGHSALPQEGLLSFEAVGDLSQIKRMNEAIKALEKGKAQNPYLGQFLFDSSQAREPKEAIEILPEDLLLKTINSSQKAAVETVLSAPDLALIQGPPGTGKTTVIAEICYQVALRGGCTLIASQANLAVDNALSRLQHNPAIRAVRKGNRNSVGIEGEPFLEENVVKTWLQNTSADCEQRLNEKLELAKILRQLLASSEQFATYHITEEKFQTEQKQLIADKEILETNYEDKLNIYAIAKGKQEEIESLFRNLDTIFTSAPSINWDETTVVSCLTGLTPFTDRDDSVEQLGINVRKTAILVKEIGLFLPERDLFALAGWLQDNIPLKLAEAHLLLNRAKNAETAMVEANSAWQTFQQNAAEESKLKQEQQKISDTIQNQQQQISTLHECSNVVQDIVSELDSSIKLHSLQIFRELQPGSGKFTDYVQTESKVNSQQKLLEESKVSIELDYQAKTKNFQEAEEKEREIEYLKTDLDTLQTKGSTVNWYEPGVINLLACLQPFINKETSAQELTKNVAVAREIAIEFGILPPEHQLFGMAGWLHKAISAQLASIRTALSYAQDAASAMVEVGSAAQALMKNKNLIAQLQSEKPKITEKRTEFQQELNSLNLQKCKIELAISNLHEWSGTASLKLYEAIERCFKQRQNLTEYSLQLPLHLVESVDFNRSNDSKPWETCLRSGNNKLSKLIAQYREWDEVSRIAHSIYSMLEEARNLVPVNNQSFSNDISHKFCEVISQKLNPSNPLQAIERLQNLTQKTLLEVKKTPGIWGRSLEFISGQNRHELLRIRLQAIAKQCNAIVRKNKPTELEPIFKQIVDETIHSIFNSSQQFLDRTNAEINQKIQQIKARLNEIENDELRISKQITTAQELVEKVRNEGKHKFNQVLTLLRQMNELPILPEPLASVAKQDLQPSDVRRLTLQFLGQVNYYQNRFDRLEALIPQLNPFRVLSNINSLITDDLNSCRENREGLSQEIKNAQYQLNKINIQLKQNLENLEAQRSQVKTEIKELLDQLVEQLNRQTRLEADIHRQILITKEQVETSKSEAKFKLETVIKLWQEIKESSQLLPQLHTFVNKCLQNPDVGIADASQLSLLIQTYENQIAQLENLIPELNPFPILSKIKNKISVNLQHQQTITAEAFKQLQDSQDQLNEIEAKLQKLIDAIKEERHWWQEYWQTIPEHLKPEEEFTDLFELNLLRRFKVQFEVWQQKLGATEAYLNRYQNLISDWIKGLKNPSEQNRHELRRIYLDNANVIGITG